MSNPITLARAVEIDRELGRLAVRMANLRLEREGIIKALMRPGGYEEPTRFGCYRLIPRTKITNRSIDTRRFLELFPHLALKYGTLRISVTKAEKGLSPEEFAQVVIPGEEVEIDPIIELDLTAIDEEPRLEVAE